MNQAGKEGMEAIKEETIEGKRGNRGGRKEEGMNIERKEENGWGNKGRRHIVVKKVSLQKERGEKLIDFYMIIIKWERYFGCHDNSNAE